MYTEDEEMKLNVIHTFSSQLKDIGFKFIRKSVATRIAF